MSKYQRRGVIAVVLVLVISDPGSIVAAEHGIDCLARTIYFEARSEPVLGQIAVAQVVINRMRDRRWPNTVCGVVKQGGARRNQCQFAWYCDGKPDVPRNERSWLLAQGIARIVQRGVLTHDQTDNATCYHAVYVQVQWAHTSRKTRQIGRHVFYVC